MIDRALLTVARGTGGVSHSLIDDVTPDVTVVNKQTTKRQRCREKQQLHLLTIK